MRPILDAILRQLITCGELGIIWPDGSRSTYTGSSAAPSANDPKDIPSATVRLRSQRTVRRLVLNPSLGAGEAYMSGELTVEDSSLYDFLDTMLTNLMARPSGHPVMQLRQRLADISRRIAQ